MADDGDYSDGVTPPVEKNLQTQPVKRVVGRPIQKGQVLNPGGRPKGLAQALRNLGADRKALEVMMNCLHSPNEKVALEASKEVLNRVWGKAVETSVQLTLDSQTDGRLMASLTPDQLHALLGVPGDLAAPRLQTVDTAPVLSEGSDPNRQTD